MHNAFVSPAEWSPSVMTLTGDEAKHLVSSLRTKEGQELVVFDGRGRSALCVVDSIDGRGRNQSVTCKVLKVHPERLPSTRLTLLQAVPKGSRMDTLVEKATELGVWRLVPLKTERVEKQPGARGFDGQVERWERISLSAAKQCGCPWLPEIEPVQSLQDGFATVGKVDLMLVGVIDENAVSLGECLSRFGKAAESVAVLIGPEGDLTADEIAAAESIGAVPVNFGRLVLRVETAAIYMASVLKSHFCWDAWI